VAAAVPGSRLTIMKGMGHFPMVENYPEFRPHLLVALDHVAERAGRRHAALVPPSP
jgi:pimeloyl-ACP methyl ester carboxylesterase